MKGYATFFLIAVMTLGLVFLLVTRSRKDHPAPGVDPAFIEAAAAPDAGDGGAATAAALLACADAALEAAAPAKPVERPLRVTALGWELVAAGVALTAAGRRSDRPRDRARAGDDARRRRGAPGAWRDRPGRRRRRDHAAARVRRRLRSAARARPARLRRRRVLARPRGGPRCGGRAPQGAARRPTR